MALIIDSSEIGRGGQFDGFRVNTVPNEVIEARQKLIEEQMEFEPTSDRYAPVIEAFYQLYYQEVGPEDKTPIQDYVEMARSHPTAGAAFKILTLQICARFGKYTHPEEGIQKWVRKNLENMRGDFGESVAQAASAVLTGYSCLEWSLSDTREKGEWWLDTLAIVDPQYYNFEGRLGEVTHVEYYSSLGNVYIPYHKLVHVVANPELAFNSPYGVSYARSAIAAWRAWKLLVPQLAIAAQRRAGGFLDVAYDEETGPAEVTDEDGNLLTVSGQIRTQHPREEAKKIAAGAATNASIVHPKAFEVNQLKVESGIDDIEKVLAYLDRLIFLSFLVPETAMQTAGNGTGDSNLNAGHVALMEKNITAISDQIEKKVIEGVIRPLVFYQFGDQDDWGGFPVPEAEPEDTTSLFSAIVSAYQQGFPGVTDLEAINFARSLLGLSELTEEQVNELINGVQEEELDEGDEEAPEDEGFEDEGFEDEGFEDEGFEDEGVDEDGVDDDLGADDAEDQFSLVLDAADYFIAQARSPEPVEDSPGYSLLQQQLADRLDVSAQTVWRYRCKGGAYFAQWSEEVDPEGLSWSYSGGKYWAAIPELPIVHQAKIVDIQEAIA